MMRLRARVVLLVILIAWCQLCQGTADSCVIIHMTDAWGDGWNGAAWTINLVDSGRVVTGTLRYFFVVALSTVVASSTTARTSSDYNTSSPLTRDH